MKIIEEIDIGIELLGAASLEQFLENEMLKRALGMTCINVGELVKVITDGLRNKYKMFPWRAVAGYSGTGRKQRIKLLMQSCFDKLYGQISR